MAGLFHKVDEVYIVFPIPGETEVGVHGGIVKDEGGRRKDEIGRRNADEGRNGFLNGNRFRLGVRRVSVK
jgi:hypothetical protein